MDQRRTEWCWAALTVIALTIMSDIPTCCFCQLLSGIVIILTTLTSAPSSSSSPPTPPPPPPPFLPPPFSSNGTFTPRLLNWFIKWHFTNTDSRDTQSSAGSHFQDLWPPPCTHTHTHTHDTRIHTHSTHTHTHTHTVHTQALLHISGDPCAAGLSIIGWARAVAGLPC